MMLRTLALAVALSCGVTSGTALAAKYKPAKVKTVKIKKDKRYKNSKMAKVKPHKAPKAKKHA